MKLRARLLIGTLSLALGLLAPSAMLSEASESSVNPYTNKTYTHNTRFQDYTIYNGIDVSKYQGTIDWAKVKADGIDYAFIRVGYTGTQSSSCNCATDPYYVTNINNAYAAGVKIGVYYFSQATTTAEAKKEAEYTLNLISAYKDKITLPVVFDFEFGTGTTSSGKSYSYRANDIKGDKTTVTANAAEFMKVVQAAGYTGMYYGNPTTLNGSFDVSDLSGYPCWLAHYTTSTSYTGDYTFWQYSSSGSVDGISGNVDMDFYYAASSTGNYVSGNSGSSSGSVTVSGVSSFKQKSNTATTITLSWKKNASADGYEIYRSTAKNGTYSKVRSISSNSTTSWKNTGRAKHRIYYYKIRAYRLVDGKKKYSSFSSAKMAHTNKYTLRYRRTKTALNVRSAAGTAYKKIATLSKNKRVKVLYSVKNRSGKTWYKISWSGKTGYVSSAYLKK